jgi:hypothetical protein
MADGIWSTALPILAKIAPMLASAVGGPFAGIAVSAIENVFGLDKTGDEAAAAAAVTGATPDQLLALKQADADFKVKMRALDIDEQRLGFEDVKDARAHDAAVRDHTPSVLAYLLTAGFFGLLGTSCFIGFPDSNRDLLNTMIGVLGTAWMAAMQFNFGSTRASAAQAQMLFNSTPVK